MAVFLILGKMGGFVGVLPKGILGFTKTAK